MSSKQTERNQEKKQIPSGWMPVTTTSKRKSVESTEVSANAENTIKADDSTNTADSLQTESTVEIGSTPKRISSRQRKESLEEYRQTFRPVPKLEDRKPVFISREVRDSLDEIARKLGGRRMSVSGFIENLARHHLEVYQDDLEMWKKL